MQKDMELLGCCKHSSTGTYHETFAFAICRCGSSSYDLSRTFGVAQSTVLENFELMVRFNPNNYESDRPKSRHPNKMHPWQGRFSHTISLRTRSRLARTLYTDLRNGIVTCFSNPTIMNRLHAGNPCYMCQAVRLPLTTSLTDISVFNGVNNIWDGTKLSGPLCAFLMKAELICASFQWWHFGNGLQCLKFCLTVG